MDNYYKPSGLRGFSFFPPVIKNLLIINVVVFFIQVIMENITFGGVPGWYAIYKWFALNPISGLDPARLPYNFQVWQLVTYQFLHGGFSHILFNMLGLWMFGVEIENVWGSRKFLYFYLICGVAGGLVHLFLSPLFGGITYTIGASGAIYGVLTAFALFFPNRYIFLYFFIPVKAKYLIAFFIIINLFLISPTESVARFAHLGGALAAFIFILLDSSSNVEIKSMFRKSSSYGDRPTFNPFSSIGSKFKKKESTIQEADFYELKDEDHITQADIDKILDKISQSGYQNLTEKEKKILFEASKKK